VDYRSLDFPSKSKKDQPFIDSLMKAEKQIHKIAFDKKLQAQTDQKKYHLGEEITLTVVNNTDKTEYFYPSASESKRALEAYDYNPEDLKKLYLKVVISKENGLLGGMSYFDPSFIGLHLSGSNSDAVSKLGYKGFDQPLKSGKSFTFKVKMPKRAGQYYFQIKRYSHGTNEIGFWGANQFIYSNTFEILEK
jgi:hypothetical protein